MATEKEIAESIGKALQSITYFPFRAVFKTGRGVIRMAKGVTKFSHNSSQSKQKPEDDSIQNDKLEREQRRREDVRLSCQLFYDQYATHLRDRLSPDQLEAYFKQYLSDNYQAAMVEKRGLLLKEMIEQLVEPDKESHFKFQSLQDISFYYQEKRMVYQNHQRPHVSCFNLVWRFTSIKDKKKKFA